MVTRRKKILETPRRRRLRRKVFIIKMILLVVFLGVIISGIIFILGLSYFGINNIEIRGAQDISSEEITQMSNEISSGNIFLIIPRKQFFVYPTQELKDKISSLYPQIKDIKIEKKGFTKIIITIIERVPTAKYCKLEGECFILDEQGYAYKTTLFEGEFNMLPLLYAQPDKEIKLGIYPLEKTKFRDLLLFANKLSDLNFHVKNILIETDESIRIVLEEGDIIISLHESLDNQFAALQTVLQEIKTFTSIDLRYGKKVFYKTE